MEPTNPTGAALVAAHKEIVRRMRIITIAFPLVLILIVIANLTAIGNQFKHLDTAAVGNDLSQRASALMPEMEGYLADVASEALPALTNALRDESAVMAPVVQKKLQDDMAALMEGAQAEFRASAEASLNELREKQREMLVTEFPAIANDRVAQDKILTASHDAMIRWATDRFNATVKEHMAALDDIRQTLEKSYTAPKGDVAAPEDALMAWLELMNERIGAHTPEQDTSQVTRKTVDEQAE